MVDQIIFFDAGLSTLSWGEVGSITLKELAEAVEKKTNDWPLKLLHARGCQACLSENGEVISVTGEPQKHIVFRFMNRSGEIQKARSLFFERIGNYWHFAPELIPS